ncbi:uncharacterized protein [Solanum lycopersicum]|uniref:uncharacterized protein n=1 Tax=Solanum lycopersicum TaxID=4081 RepID=UPI00374A8777
MTEAELGSFCQDFGFPALKPPSAKRADKNNRQENKRVSKKSSKSKDYKPKKKASKESSSGDTCWTCGKKGHRSNQCPRNKKKKKKISLLQVDEETKDKLFSILEEEESESDSESTHSQESSNESDEEFMNIAQDSDNETTCDCHGPFCLCGAKDVKVLSERTAETLFETIEHIQDEDARRKYLLELQKLVTKHHHEERPHVEPFSMKQIMSRFDHKRDEPSIDELRGEVNTLKKEIRDFKSRLHCLEINDLANDILKTSSPKELGEPSNQADSDEDDSAGVTMITKVRPQSSHIMIKLVVNNNLILNKIALLDSGADRNCIVEGLIPTKYLQKGTTRLYSATGFNEQAISTKARPIQMNQELMEICKTEINSLLNNKIIRPSKSPWSCSAFYVNNAAEKERGAPRYPIPNKRDLLKRTFKANVYSKFDMKSSFWQIQISEKDKYKTAFNVPFGQYEWNVMPFGLKNAPSEFQNIMNSIFNCISQFSIVYIDDVLIFSEDIDSHFKHLNSFFNIVKNNGLVVSAKKILLFQTKIRFLGHDLFHGTYLPICRAIEFADKFPDVIIDKTQLQRFLGSLNYVADFIPKIRQNLQTFV